MYVCLWEILYFVFSQFIIFLIIKFLLLENILCFFFKKKHQAELHNLIKEFILQVLDPFFYMQVRMKNTLPLAWLCVASQDLDINITNSIIL